jgi:hypothetical protein
MCCCRTEFLAQVGTNFFGAVKKASFSAILRIARVETRQTLVVLSQASANLEFEQNKDMQATAKRPYSRLLKSPEIRQKPIDSPTCICYNTRNWLRNRFRNLL